MYSRTIAEKANATLLSESRPQIQEALQVKKKPGQTLKHDIDTRFHASSDYKQYGLSNYTIEYIQGAEISKLFRDPNGDSS